MDDVVDPAETRSRLISALEMLRVKNAPQPSRKHGNPPL